MQQSEPAPLSLADVIGDLAAVRYTDVELVPGRLWARCHEMGVRHVRAFTGDLMRVGQAVFAAGHENERDLMAMLVPHLIDHAFKLIEETVEVGVLDTTGKQIERIREPLDELPHEFLPIIVQAWVEQSFGDLGKWKPWADAIESLVRRLTGKDEFSVGKLLSDRSSREESASENSSSSSSQDGPTSGGPTTSLPSSDEPSQSTPSFVSPSRETLSASGPPH